MRTWLTHSLRVVPGVALCVATLALSGGALPGCDEGSGEEEAHGHGHAEAAPFGEVVFGPGQMSEDADWAVSAVVPAPRGATRIGMLVDLSSPLYLEEMAAQIEVRGYAEDGSPLAWTRPEVTFKEDRYLVARSDSDAPIKAAQLRVPSALIGKVAYVTFAAMIPETDAAKADGPGDETASFALLGPGVYKSRATWKAKSTKCTSNDPNKYRMAIHHTFTPATSGGSYEARLRSIQAYHMDTRGWCDIGYHFLVTDDGSVWEGRPIKHRGAHVSNNNTGNVGISFVGCFQTGECDALGSMNPSAASLQGASALVAALADEYGIAITASAIKGHKQHSGSSTSCPGDKLFAKIGDIMAMAKGAPAPVDPDPTPEPQTGTIQGVVWDLSVTPQPSDAGVQLVTGAGVSVAGATAKAVDPETAYWSFELPAGTWTVMATAAGYQPQTRTITVVAGQSQWGSIGLVPTSEAPADPQPEPEPEPEPEPTTTSTVRVKNSGGAALADSVVYVEGLGSAQTDAAGQITFQLATTTATIRAFAVNYHAVVTEIAQGETLDVVLQAEAQQSGGTAQGVVWDASQTSSPSASGAIPLDDAIVVSSFGTARKARPGDAYWSFVLPAGEHTFTAVSQGYAPASSTAQIASGAGAWASIGLYPTGSQPSDPPPAEPPPPADPPPPATPATPTVCYPGTAQAWDVCFDLVAGSSIAGSAYTYPTGGPSAQYASPTHFIDLLAADPSTKLSPNFKLSELMQSSKGQYGIFTPASVVHLQKIRNALGVPLVITSGFRSPGYNAGISGSATYSRHMYGDAADMSTNGAVSLTTLKNTCLAEGADYTQVYTSHVHCDWRNDGLHEGFWGGAEATGQGQAGSWMTDPSDQAWAWVSAPQHVPAPGDAIVLSAKYRGFPEGTPWVRWTVRGPETALTVEPAVDVGFEAPLAGTYYVTWEVGEMLNGELAIEVR